jgi:D-alanine-D-alanine ligase
MDIAVLFVNRKEAKAGDWDGRDSNDDAESVINALKSLGHNVTTHFVDANLYEKLNDKRKDIDLVFNICDDGFYTNPELEPHLPAMLDILKMTYTGSNYLCLAITMNKALVKKLLTYHNLPTPNFQVFETGDEPVREDLKFPLIVKPVREDASIGIRDRSVVSNKEDLLKRIDIVIKRYKQPALVEEFIDGREFNVGVIGDGNKEVLPIAEIAFDGMPDRKPRIVNYDAKWKENSVSFKFTNRKCPAEIPVDLKQKLKELAIKAGAIFNCKDYFRVDFRVRDNEPYILEVNQNPDISENAGLASMAKAAGYTYTDLIDRIIKSALTRKEEKKRIREVIKSDEEIKEKQNAPEASAENTSNSNNKVEQKTEIIQEK